MGTFLGFTLGLFLVGGGLVFFALAAAIVREVSWR